MTSHSCLLVVLLALGSLEHVRAQMGLGGGGGPMGDPMGAMGSMLGGPGAMGSMLRGPGAGGADAANAMSMMRTIMGPGGPPMPGAGGGDVANAMSMMNSIMGPGGPPMPGAGGADAANAMSMMNPIMGPGGPPGPRAGGADAANAMSMMSSIMGTGGPPMPGAGGADAANAMTMMNPIMGPGGPPGPRAGGADAANAMSMMSSLMGTGGPPGPGGHLGGQATLNGAKDLLKWKLKMKFLRGIPTLYEQQGCVNPTTALLPNMKAFMASAFANGCRSPQANDTCKLIQYKTLGMQSLIKAAMMPPSQKFQMLEAIKRMTPWGMMEVMQNQGGQANTKRQPGPMGEAFNPTAAMGGAPGMPGPMGMAGPMSAMMGGPMSSMMGGPMSAMMGGPMSAMMGGPMSAMMGGPMAAMMGGGEMGPMGMLGGMMGGEMASSGAGGGPGMMSMMMPMMMGGGEGIMGGEMTEQVTNMRKQFFALECQEIGPKSSFAGMSVGFCCPGPVEIPEWYQMSGLMGAAA